MENNLENSEKTIVFKKIRKILELEENSTYKDMYLKFLKEDQELMNKWGDIDYTSLENKTTQVKNLLSIYETDDPASLDEGLKNILWLWYHHASQFIFQKGDKETAILYIEKALKYLDHDNKISQFLLYIYKDDLKGAENYLTLINNPVELNTAKELLTFYKDQKNKEYPK